MPAVASGDLRHKVQLQENQITQDSTTGEMVHVDGGFHAVGV